MAAMRKNILAISVGTVLLLTPFFSQAQEVLDDYRGTWRAEVLEIVEEKFETIAGTETTHQLQTIKARVLEGPQKNEEVIIENDYFTLETGDRFYFNHYVFTNGSEVYGIINIDRQQPLYMLLFLFVGAVVLFGGWMGARALLALLGSFFAIFYILLPGILAGWNPIFASVLVAAGILFGAIFFTHGFNRESLVAYGGTMIAVLLTSVFALFAVSVTDLTGFSSEVTTYLNINTGGTLDFTALLLGAIIIGVLGVLDDIAVTQAAVVTELWSSNKNLSRREVYTKAIRVGREHVGALVNTLVLAYAGASLPLLLHVYMSASSVDTAINTELFATEIVRTIVGSIGLILAVPIVTALAVFYLKDYTPKHPHSHPHGHNH